MLEIGNGEMTLYQQQTHFAFWAALKSPLIIGADLSKLSDESVAVLKNKDIIAVNQDSLGQAVHYIESASKEGAWQVWAGPVNGGFVVLLLNEKSYPQALSVSFADLRLGLDGPVQVTELWSHKALGKVDGYKGVLQPYQTLVFRLRF